MKRQNVWYISKYANIKKYGADSRHSSFCNQFAKSGYNVRLITSNFSHLHTTLPMFKGMFKDELYNGFNVTWIKSVQYRGVTSFRRVIGWVWFEIAISLMIFGRKYEKPDVVIVSSLSLFSVISGCLLKRFYGSKFIFEVRDIWPQTLIDLKGVSPRHPLVWILSKLEVIGYRYSDEIVGTMPGLSEHVFSVLSERKRVSFIPQGVDLDIYETEQSEVSDDYLDTYFPKGKFVVTYSGTFGNANALEYVIDAARILQSSGFNEISFLMVGDGVLKSELIRYADGLHNIVFAPAVAKNQVLHILSQSDLLIASVRDEKIYRYGISLNKFVDYMYAKKPVLCMFSGYPSMLNEANCGEFVPAENCESFAQSILRYANLSECERRLLGNNGHKFLVESRNFEVLSRQYMELF